MAITAAVVGMSGSGKTTILGELARICTERGKRTKIINVESTPGALALRACAEQHPLDHILRFLPLWAIRLLQMEEMRQHLESNCHDLILSDRCLESIATNNVDRRVPEDVINWVVSQATFEPAMTLFLDAPLEEVLRRSPLSKTLQNPSHAVQIFKIHQDLAAMFRWTRIDATQPIEAVTRDCLQALGL